MKTIVLLLMVIILPLAADAQSWSGDARVLRRGGVTIDSLPLLTWPEHLPAQALSETYQAPRTQAAMIGKDQLVIPLAQNMDPSLRSYVAVYYAAQLNRMSQATLWRSGMGITQLKVPLDRPGYYLAIVIGPVGPFTQLFYYDGSSVRQGRREAKKLVIADP